MNYAKPEVVVLGKAVRMIEIFPILKGTRLPADPFFHRIQNPAYDLDE